MIQYKLPPFQNRANAYNHIWQVQLIFVDFFNVLLRKRFFFYVSPLDPVIVSAPLSEGLGLQSQGECSHWHNNCFQFIPEIQTAWHSSCGDRAKGLVPTLFCSVFSVSLFPVIVLFLIYFVRLYTHFSVYARAAYTRIHYRYLLYMTSSK